MPFEQPKTEKTPEQKEKIKLPEIMELEGPVKRILEQIKDKIENHEYTSVLGDDTSGRIPALLLSKIINKIYKEQGNARLNTLFTASGRELTNEFKSNTEMRKQWEITEKYLESVKNALDKRTLLVTEYVFSGKTVLAISQILDKLGIGVDIAAITAPEQEDDKEMKENLRHLPSGFDFIIGIRGFRPHLYRNAPLAGVQKQEMKEGGMKYVKPVAEKYDFSSAPSDDIGRRDLMKEDFIQARKDINVLADKIVEWYKEENQKAKIKNQN